MMHIKCILSYKQLEVDINQQLISRLERKRISPVRGSPGRSHGTVSELPRHFLTQASTAKALLASRLVDYTYRDDVYCTESPSRQCRAKSCGIG
jgi:hypothetical protein